MFVAYMFLSYSERSDLFWTHCKFTHFYQFENGGCFFAFFQFLFHLLVEYIAAKKTYTFFIGSYLKRYRISRVINFAMLKLQNLLRIYLIFAIFKRIICR